VNLQAEPAEEDEVIEGEEMAPPPAPPKIAPVAALSVHGPVQESEYPADFLDDGLADDLWRRRFWALVRLLVKKGVLTKDEVNKALRALD
jgi:hypothetical protein